MGRWRSSSSFILQDNVNVTSEANVSLKSELTLAPRKAGGLF